MPSRFRSTPRPGRHDRAGDRLSRPSAPPTTRRTSRVVDQPGDSEMAGNEQRERGTRGAKLTGRAAVLVLVLAVLAVSYATSVRAWLKQQHDVAALSAQIANRHRQIAALKETKQRWNDPAFIETQARLRFGWLMPGETGYRVIGADGKTLPAGNVSLASPLPPAKHQPAPWYQVEWGSVVAAGKTAAQIARERRAEQHPAKRISMNSHPGSNPVRNGPGPRHHR